MSKGDTRLRGKLQASVHKTLDLKNRERKVRRVWIQAIQQSERETRELERELRPPKSIRNLGIGEVRKVYRHRLGLPEAPKPMIDQHIRDALGEDWKEIDCEEREQRMSLKVEERKRLGLRLHHATDVSRKEEQQIYAARTKVRNAKTQQRRREAMKEAAMSTGLSERRDLVIRMVRVLGRADNETLAKAACNSPDWRITDEWAPYTSMLVMMRRITSSLVDDGYLICEFAYTRGRPKKVFSIAGNAHSTLSNKGTKKKAPLQPGGNPDEMGFRTTGVTALKRESPHESIITSCGDGSKTVH
jgi:hypothetical protein